MKRILMLALLVAGFCGCSDNENTPPILVTDIVMPTGVSDPGEEVTITAKGFEAADDIFVRMGGSILRAEVVRVESSLIRFVVPGGLPAGNADILLMRSGEYMILGQMKFADGLPPKFLSLYGISRNLAGETLISRIDFETGKVTHVAALGETQRLTNIVNVPGTNTIYGISDLSGERKSAWYDLTTKRYGGLERSAITMGVFGSTPAALIQLRPGVVSLYNAGFTRSNMGEPGPIGWDLPENITTEMLTAYPFLSVYNAALLSARIAAGNYRPLVIEMTGRERIFACDPIEADALLPFRVVQVSGTNEPYHVGGYAEVKQNETIFRLFNPNTLAMDEELFRVPAAVISCANTTDGVMTSRIYMLCRTETGAKVYTYDLKADDPNEAFKPLTGEVDFSEIVLAR